MLKVERLHKSFGGVAAINDVSLEFPSGTLSALIGPNGAGKTTFFNLVCGALRPDSGRILLERDEISGLDPLGVVRRGIGRAFQVASVFPSLTVEESLMGALLAHRGEATVVRRRFPLAAARPRAHDVMEMLGLSARARTLSRNLSHGDQKLLDIALALVLQPRVLLLDEPTAGMGPEERWQMIDKVHRLWQSEKMTLIFIEHDMDIVFRIAQSVRVLCYGKVLAEGAPARIRADPAVIEAYLGAPGGEDAA